MGFFNDENYNGSGGEGGGLSPADRVKLDSIEFGAEKNENAFGKVKVGTEFVNADNATDTLELVAGNDIELTINDTDNKIEINSKGGWNSDSLILGTTNILRKTATTLSVIANTGLWKDGNWKASDTNKISIQDMFRPPSPDALRGWRIANYSVSASDITISQSQIPTELNATYTLSFYTKFQSSGNTDFIIECSSVNKAYVKEVKNISNEEWYRHIYTFKVDEVGDINIILGLKTGSTGMIDICGMKLEKGNKVSDWSSSPWDVNTVFSETDREKLDGIEVNANNYVHPVNHPPSIISQDSNNRFVSDTEKASWNSKADGTIATSTKNGLLSKEDKTKLDGVEIGANNYIHPDKHPASIIEQDSNNRLVTDSQISQWNSNRGTGEEFTTAEKQKLSGIEDNANNYVHPDTHPADIIVETADKRFVSDVQIAKWDSNSGGGTGGLEYTQAEKDKLAGIAPNANNYTHPTSHPATMITEDSTHRFVTDAEKASWNSGTGGGSGVEYTQAEKDKLAGIATGANNYVHPATHPPTIIAQDSNNRFVTDDEKAKWNLASGTGGFTQADRTKLDGIETGANNYVHPSSHQASMIVEEVDRKFMKDAERTKLSGIADNANNYIHPEQHPPTIITQDASNRFVTDAQIAKWNSAGNPNIQASPRNLLISNQWGINSTGSTTKTELSKYHMKYTIGDTPTECIWNGGIAYKADINKDDYLTFLLRIKTTTKVDVKIIPKTGSNSVNIGSVAIDPTNGEFVLAKVSTIALVDKPEIVIYAFSKNNNNTGGDVEIKEWAMYNSNSEMDWIMSPEDIESQLGDLKIGGKNYLLNSGAEYFLQNWTKVGAYGIMNIEEDLTKVFEGKRAFRVENPSTDYADAILGQRVSVQGGVKFAISGFVRPTFNNGGTRPNAKLTCAFYKSDGSLISEMTNVPTFKVVSTSYSKTEFLGITPVDTAQIEVRMAVAGMIALFDNVKLEFGDVATDWTPLLSEIQTPNTNTRNLVLDTGMRNVWETNSPSKGDVVKTDVGMKFQATRDTGQNAMMSPLTITPTKGSILTISLRVRGVCEDLALYFKTATGVSEVLYSKVASAIPINSTTFTTVTATFEHKNTSGLPVTKFVIASSLYPMGQWLEVEKNSVMLTYGDGKVDWQPAPEDINNRIDSLESANAGGRNYLLNGGFEYLLKDWFRDDNLSGDFLINSSDIYSGKNALKLSNTIAKQNVKVKEDTKFTINGFLKVISGNASSNIKIGINYYKGTTLISSVSDVPMFKATTTTYVNSKYKGIVPKGVDTIQIALTALGSATVYFDNIMLEFGDFYSDWQPAPEDSLSEGIRNYALDSQMSKTWSTYLPDRGDVVKTIDGMKVDSSKKTGENGMLTKTSRTFVEGEVLTLSFKARGSLPTLRASIKGQSGDGSIMIIDDVNIASKINPTTFTEFNSSFIVKNNVLPSMVNLYIGGIFSALNQSFEIQKNSVVLTSGINKVDWTPAPEETIAPATTTDLGMVKQIPFIPDISSTATLEETITALNGLLTQLRTSGIMKPS